MYLSRCRNCECLHFYGPDSECVIPENCYCPELLLNGCDRCPEYSPLDNLEYLEWLYEKRNISTL